MATLTVCQCIPLVMFDHSIPCLICEGKNTDKRTGFAKRNVLKRQTINYKNMNTI